MRAIILAAGRGSRMKDLTDDRPKCLVELHGKALLDWQLEALRGAGITEIAVVTGYKREMLAGRGLVEFHNERWSETQMVTSLACAEEWLKTGPCIVSYSDIFYDTLAVSSLMESKALLAVTYDPNWLELWQQRFDDPLDDAETFLINSSGYVAEIGSRPKSIQDIQGQYMGLLKFSPDGWDCFSKFFNNFNNKEKSNMDLTRVLNRLIIEKNCKILAVEYIGKWGEIDNKNDVEIYNKK